MKEFSTLCFSTYLILLIRCEIGATFGDGRCKSPGNCCTGRDSSCFVNNGDSPSDGSIYFGNSINQPCYCDEGCLETGDCCSDYEKVCTFQGKR